MKQLSEKGKDFLCAVILLGILAIGAAMAIYFHHQVDSSSAEDTQVEQVKIESTTPESG